MTIQKIEASTLRFTRAGLINDDMYVDLMAFYIAQIGEQFAPDKLSSKIKTAYFSDTEVSDIYGMRNFLSRHYGNAQSSRVLGTVQRDSPKLKPKLKKIQDYLLTQVEEL